MAKNSLVFRVIFMFVFAMFCCSNITCESKKISVNIDLKKGDFVYKDHINVSSDHPDVVIKSWDIGQKEAKHFSKEFRETKKTLDKSFVIAIEAEQKGPSKIKDAHIHVAYYLNSKGGMVEETVPFDDEHELGEMVKTSVSTGVVEEKNSVPLSDSVVRDSAGGAVVAKDGTENGKAGGAIVAQDGEKSGEAGETKSLASAGEGVVGAKKLRWTEYLQNLVQTTQSVWVKILLSLLLGMLLSLTPCIYPMIPITVGILQSQGSKSLWSNFFLSFVYVMGISITFAVLGLIAAFTGQVFGSLLTNPIFIIILVAILVYLTLSMFGFYEIYIPRFMQQKGDSPHKSILSIFLFGVASGSIASPCVSPGLILILSIVTALGSKFLGFLLLFCFGLGLGAPLILVGTFSGAVNKLPRAGMWMLEIKKIFGLLILSVCFYFLSNILALNILLYIMSSFAVIVGMYYLFSVGQNDSKFWKLFKNLFGIGCCALSILFAFNGYKETYLIGEKEEIQFWLSDFDLAVQKAKQENKKLFIDFSTGVCSSCRAIDKKVFSDKAIIAVLVANFVNLKVDGSDMAKEPFASLSKTYKIIGFPTFLLIDQNTGQELRRWSSEFYNMPNAEIIELFEGLK